MYFKGFPGGISGKEPACQCRRRKRNGFNPWVRKMPWRRKWQPTLVSLPRESHGQRTLVDYGPWDSLSTNTGAGSHVLLQGIFLTQGSNPCLLCLLHYRQILYPLRHQGSLSQPENTDKIDGRMYSTTQGS